jgi:hypothetical protein
LDWNIKIEEVTDLEHMVGLGVMNTPALAVDGKVKMEGRVPPVGEIEQILDSPMTICLR